MDLADDSSPQAINEIYKIWKKNTPFLYNTLQTYELPSCSQTIQWMPQKYILDSWEINYLIVGSNSPIKNNISMVQVKLPTDQSIVDHTAYKQLTNVQDKKNAGQAQTNFVGTIGQQFLNISKNFPQVGQIMKVRTFKGAQKNGQMLAVSIGGVNPIFYVCDIAQDPQVVDQNKIALNEHESQGFGIDWHPQNNASLITGAFDHKLCLWDITQTKAQIYANKVYVHDSPVQDVKWCKKDTNLIGSACQNSTINIWDLRQNGQKPSISKQAHKGEAFTIDFNNFTQHLLLSGGSDSEIVLWDTRNMNKSLNSFIGHNQLVSSVKWSTNNPYKFTSSSFDRRVVVWDIRCNSDQNEMADQNEEANQISFIHGGHRSRVTDFCWNQEDKVCASVQEYNMIHVWQMNQKLQR